MIIAQQEVRIESLIKQNTELTTQSILHASLLEKFGEEIERLKKQINVDSTNSSTPPSKDQKPNKVIFNSREKSGKKSGGQTGHKGHCLSRQDIENKIKLGLLKHKIVVHGEPNGEPVKKFELGIEINGVAIEHHFYGKVPVEFQSDVQYGNDIKAFATMLIGRGIVASNRVVELISAITENAINLSDGSIYNWLQEFHTKAEKKCEEIETNLLNGTNLQVDETGARCEKKNMCFRNYSNEENVLYTLNPTKGKKAIEDDGILPKYVGTMIHDHNTVNYNYGTNHAECNVHTIRYLKATYADTKNYWASEMISFLTELNNARKFAMLYGLTQFEPEDLKRYQQRYDDILTMGFASNENTKSRYFKKEEKKLLKRLKKYKDNHLLFLSDFTVPFDNNMSERDLRMIKGKTKMSGCFRSLSGGRWFASLMSIIKTAIKQNLSPFKEVRAVFAA